VTGGRSLEGRRILVVEDDRNLAEVIVATLDSEGADTGLARSGSEALERAAAWRPELVLLDAGLPDLDGFEVLGRLRAAGNDVPVVFLTARRAVADRVRGLDAGAVDYLVKPFDFAELLARLRVVLRSVGASGQTRWQVGDLVVDHAGRTVTVGGAPVHLSPNEYKLLHCLVRNAGKVVARAQLYDEVWSYDFGSDSAIIDTLVSRVRRKVDPDGTGLIATVRGQGFLVREPA
jgi:two-component system OmpR family response regulator